MQIPQLQRGLKSRHISLIALGGIIGSSYFLGTGYVFGKVGPSAFFTYILGGLISYITIACLAEMSCNVAASGSFVNYTTKFISPVWGCGVGWSYFISWLVYIPSECIAGGILMHHFTPSIPPYLWSILFGLWITHTNLSHVKMFGEVEFWLALVKIFALIGFSVLACLIFFGWVGTNPHYLGDTYFLEDGGLFPNGVLILFVNMVILMSNFQGSEIIGLSTSETHNPEVVVPATLRKVSFRIIGLYLIPTLLLALIFPWQKAGLSGSAFSDALAYYGLTPFAHVFSFLIIAGAISCANSGLYATIRSLYALTSQGMAPQALLKLNDKGVPVRATVVTLVFMWPLLLLTYFFPSHKTYANLLAMSGFTGTICWICIGWSQFRFRKMMKKMERTNTYQAPGFPYLTLFAIWVQIFSLIIVLLSKDLRAAFYFGVPALVVPMLIFKYRHKFVR